MKPYFLRTRATWLWPAIVALLIGLGLLTRDRWLPGVRIWMSDRFSGGIASGDNPLSAEHRDAHGEANSEDSLHLSAQALRNIGLSEDKIRPISLETFTRTLTFPAMIVERPGHTRFTIAAPMTGLIAAIHVIEGETVGSGEPLFQLRLTHEDLIRSQSDFLRTLEELDVEIREIARLESIADEGIVAGKSLLERKYEKQKLEAVLRASRESLLLHGLSEEQVTRIEDSRRLIQEVTVSVPFLHADASLHDDSEARRNHEAKTAKADSRSGGAEKNDSGHCDTVPADFVVDRLAVSRGQMVEAGTILSVLSDFRELSIQGQAFEYDAESLLRAATRGYEVSAVRRDSMGNERILAPLHIAYVDNTVEAESRALYFYVPLENKMVRDHTTTAGHRFVKWQYKLGQRLQLRVPVEQWPERIVVPIDAVAQEGPESFVFQQDGDRFLRRSVHVEYRDRYWAVLANDGSLFLGDRVAMTGAYQMHLALKNKSGPIDPHAGHRH